MGKYDVDFEDYEEKAGFTGAQPPAGLYEAKLSSLAEHTTSDDALVFTFDIVEEGPYLGWRGYIYANMSSAKWRVQQIAKAIQGGSEKPMSMNPDNAAAIIKKAKQVRIRTKMEKYNGEDRAKIATIVPSESAGTSKPAKETAATKEPWDEDDED